MTRVALQLWTIRDEIERDLEGSLRRVGELGYDGVELIALPDHDLGQVRAWLAESGLAAAGRHTSLEAVENELPALVDELGAFGTDRVAIAWIDPELLADPGPIVERFADAAAAARDAGLQLGFHNHWSEVTPLAGGATFLDLLRELPPELLWLELDLGWVWHAGGDPIAELDVPIGDGIVGYERVIPAAIAAGAEWLIVEEDEVGPDPFGAVARSLDAVRRIVNE
jgi:sugar phosphate isomerase/epimerase